MFKSFVLIFGVLFAAAVSALANENVHMLDDNEPISDIGDGVNVIPVVQTVDGVETTVYYTIIEEQTIVNGGQSSSADPIDHDLAAYPNIANALKNMGAFEDLLASILKENPDFGMIKNSQDNFQVSASMSA